MIKERILCICIGWAGIALFVAGLAYGIWLIRKGSNKRLFYILLCEIAVFLAVAYIAFTIPEFYREKQKRAWDEVRTNGYILTLNGKRPNRREERKIVKRRRRYELNDIYDEEMRVDVRPTERSPIQSVEGLQY